MSDALDGSRISKAMPTRLWQRTCGKARWIRSPATGQRALHWFSPQHPTGYMSKPLRHGWALMRSLQRVIWVKTLTLSAHDSQAKNDRKETRRDRQTGVIT